MKDVEYRIVRSARRKKLTISVERDKSVVVHAPNSTPDEVIRHVVESKRQWLFEKLNHPQKYQHRLHPPGKEVVNGESAPYLGRDYRIEVIDTESGEVEFARGFVVPKSLQSRRRDVLKAWYIARAEDTILSRAYKKARELGVKYSGAYIVDNRYRWGSCTVGSAVSFNWRLIKAPMFVVEYVIAHELAHLLEGNHTDRFWNIVRTNCPAMEKAKAWLKEHGQILEEEV